MAFVTPTTRSTGNTITAAIWNADVVDNQKWLAGDTGGKPSCRVYNNSALVLANGVVTSVTFDSESWDKGSCHSTVSNTSRITIPAGCGGVWDFGACVEFAANATGTRFAIIILNGSTILAKSEVPGVATTNIALSVSTTYIVSAAQYVEVQVYQNSGGNLNLNRSPSYSPEFWATWQGLP